MAEKEYIERVAAINQFTTNSGVFVYGVKGVAAIISRLRAIPAADVVEVRHGAWIEENDGTHSCSKCGHDATYTFDGTEIWGVACPFCGAKMDGKGESE